MNGTLWHNVGCDSLIKRALPLVLFWSCTWLEFLFIYLIGVSLRRSARAECYAKASCKALPISVFFEKAGSRKKHIYRASVETCYSESFSSVNLGVQDHDDAWSGHVDNLWTELRTATCMSVTEPLFLWWEFTWESI